MRTWLAENTSLTPRKIGALLFTGFIIGALCVSMGWAAKKPAVRAAAKKKPAVKTLAKHKVVPVKKVIARPVFKEYTHPNGLYHLRHPPTWKIADRGDAMVMRSMEKNGQRGVFGIIRRPEDQPNEEAVTREFTAVDKPDDLTQTAARVAGMRAIKVVGSSKDNPDNRMVEYYAQNQDGQQYYILLMAPRDEWQRYSPTFNTMLSSLNFN